MRSRKFVELVFNGTLYTVGGPKIGTKFVMIPEKKDITNLYQLFIIYINTHFPYVYLVKGGAKNLVLLKL